MTGRTLKECQSEAEKLREDAEKILNDFLKVDAFFDKAEAAARFNRKVAVFNRCVEDRRRYERRRLRRGAWRSFLCGLTLKRFPCAIGNHTGLSRLPGGVDK